MATASTINSITGTDLIALGEEDFSALRIKVITEQERRDALAQIPQNIARQAAHYRSLGGADEDLIAVIPAAAPTEDGEAPPNL